MKILSSYKFKNDKEFQVRYLNNSDQKRAGIPDCDSLGLAFVADDEVSCYYLRPDEVVIIIALLSEALFKAVKGYDVGLLRGYNGFGK